MNMNIKERIDAIIYNESLEVNLSDNEIQLIESFPMEQTIPVLREAFDKGVRREVKSRAFDAILAIRAYDRVQFLVDCLEQFSNEWPELGWRTACCRELSRFPDARAITTLCQILLQDQNEDMRYIAAESLGTVGDASALACLEYAHMYDKGRDYEGFPIADAAGEALQLVRQRLNAASREG